MVGPDGRPYPVPICYRAVRSLRRRECEAIARGEYDGIVPGGCEDFAQPEEPAPAEVPAPPEDDIKPVREVRPGDPAERLFSIPDDTPLDQAGRDYFRRHMAALIALRRTSRGVSDLDRLALLDAALADQSARRERLAEAEVRSDFWVDAQKQARAARQHALSASQQARFAAQRVASTGLGAKERGERATAAEAAAMEARTIADSGSSRWADLDLP
ncbi:hypothetical protein [uncultured Albimonas sp.]|uniref:hypothetical protein n=1 Tax=uncultured Albimonas sp. TaxID=1331701 RepID=UPI0030ECDD57